MSFLSLVTILRSIQPINGHFSPQSLKDIFPNIPAKDKAVVFVLQKREEEYRVAKLGCRLINTRSQSYCVSYKAEMAPWEPPQILVSTLLQLHDCSGPLCFDWRRNELPLNQTVLINLFHTTNIPYFSQHSSNHTKPDWSTTFDFFFFFSGIRIMHIYDTKPKCKEGTDMGKTAIRVWGLFHNWMWCTFCLKLI